MYTYLFQGLYCILALDVAVATCGVLFYNVNQTAGLLFIPYAAWLALATTLNYVIHRDNSDTEKIKEIKD